MSDIDKTFLARCCKMWEDAEDSHSHIDDLYKYYRGDKYSNPADSFFIKETKTPLNVIGQIVDAKHSSVLDAQFSVSVVPEVYNFSDMQSIKDLQDVANVLDKALKQSLKNNKEDDIKERSLRWGFIKRGCVQTTWDTTDNPQGDVKISVVDPRNVRFTKGAKSEKDMTMVAYSVDIDAVIAKRDYARLDDGSFDLELCKKIDEAAGNKSEPQKGEAKAIASYSTDTSAGLAYVRDSQSQSTGKILNVVVMFLFDGSLEVPEKNQSVEETELAQEMKMQYPNGRMVMFVPEKDKQLILKDEPAPASFKSLGNTDFLILNKLDGFDAKSTVENLIPIQERINGCIRKMRSKIGGDISTTLFDERMRGVTEDNAFVNLPITFIEQLGDFQPPQLDNHGIEKAGQLKMLIDGYVEDAYKAERISQAWANGVNQDNVKSGDHADALNESAMTAIRSNQRSYSEFYISICEKVVALIVENYSEQRLINVGCGFDAKEYAMFDTDEQGNKSIQFIDDSGKIARMIKLDPAWKFKVAITDGTVVPRSRRENARLVDEVIASPIMQSGDIDMIDMYLTAKDMPNRHAIVTMLKKKQDEAAKNQPTVLETMAKNPEVMKAWAMLFKNLEGFSVAQGQLLKKADLDGTTDTITSAPAQSVTSKSQAKDIAIVAPQQISSNPIQAKFGHDQASDLTIIEHSPQNRPMPEEAFHEV